ncbi:glyoxalase family protein [Luminiphilus syltensis NOR5-1B]|uniref:Glyoxalase family protein n=1 Tax=Luminiphilus syltensis NOR5-1B TaxID=565045 RepID=B8KQR0_9GAMM|nr:VOC family protein [Luminiphilus syltensis]EED36911.1 glyoxalase family protein [Luminiphilus syltensis NOR5-1B]
MISAIRLIGFSCLFLYSAVASATEIELTRHLIQLGVDTPPGPQTSTFFGVPGKARLIVSGADETLSLELNNQSIALTSDGDRTEVLLTESNSLTVNVLSVLDSPASIRIKQAADIELSVASFIHFNTNVSDFATARDFYGSLGFDTISGFPDTNTQAMARAIGIETPTEYDGSQGGEAGGYLLHGELVGPGGFFGGVIDLISFTIPKDDAPPYAAVNHLGMARGAMLTSNLDADYEYMKAQGVDLLSAPVTRADGTRFFMFKDLDGTFYELIEGRKGDGDEPTETTHIYKMAFVNVNVSDFERSLAWYQMFGYEVSGSLHETDSLEVAEAMGLDRPYRIKGAMLTHQSDGSEIKLVQWLEPYNAEAPYPLPVNHLGIHRMALASTDIESDVAALKAQGVEFVSPITPCCSPDDPSSSIVAFYDPDGTIVELAEVPYLFKFIPPVVRWYQGLFDD